MSDLRFQRAFLVNPPTGLYRRDDRCQCRIEDQTVQITFPPMDLASIGAVLQELGVEVQVRDYPAEGGTWDSFIEDLNTFRPDFFMLNVVTATAEADFQACRAVEDALGSDVLIAARGEYMEALGLEAMRDHPEIDFGLHGEVERVVEEICKGGDLASQTGLLYRTGAGNNGSSDIRRNPGHPVVEDLDSLPLPSRALLRNEIYTSPESGKPLTVIHGNRGCPAHCIFCPAGVMSGFRVRYRSPESVIREIKSCVEDFGIREFLFHGDTFTMNKKWLIELCEGIVAEGLDVHWGCNSRVDTMDDDRARAMKAAGCWVVAFGLETGNQEILDKLKKGATLAEAEEAIAVCKRNGLRTQGFYVIGLPWETEETLEETFQFARKLDTDFFDFNIAYPLPGTEFYELAVAENLFERPVEETGYANSAVRTYTLSSDRLSEWRRKALLRMFLRPQYIARMLWKSGSPRQTVNYVRAGAKRLRQLVASSSAA